jgi:DNA-binding GntR family transcriptional regulator
MTASTKPQNILNHRSLVHKTVDHIKDGIIQGKFKQGEHLLEMQIAKDLTTSRAPVREAFRILEIEGWVDAFPRKGVRVRPLTAQDVEGIYEIRSTLDALAVRLAMPQLQQREINRLKKLVADMALSVQQNNLDTYKDANAGFHALFYEKCKNQWLTKIACELTEQTNRLRTVSFSIPGRLRQSLEEHQKILEAVVQDRISEAETIMRCHMDSAGNLVTKLLAGQVVESNHAQEGNTLAHRSRQSATSDLPEFVPEATKLQSSSALLIRTQNMLEPVSIYPSPLKQRVISRYDVHELVLLLEPNSREGKSLGFLEFQNGNAIRIGDSLSFEDKEMCSVAGFDESPLPNHLRILIQYPKDVEKKLLPKMGCHILFLYP